jgi:hypothetical protein
MKSFILWDITSYNLLQVDQHFVSVLHIGFLRIIFFSPEDGGHVPLKPQFTFSGLHSVISQKIELRIRLPQCLVHFHGVMNVVVNLPGSLKVLNLLFQGGLCTTEYPDIIKPVDLVS